MSVYDNFVNFAKSRLPVGIDAVQNTFSVTPGEGSKFPAIVAPNTFQIVIYDTFYADPGDDPDVEICTVNQLSVDSMQVNRAQEGTTAKAHNTAGRTYNVIAGLTAISLKQAPVYFGYALSDEGSNLTVGAAKVTVRMPYRIVVEEFRASVNTAPTGSPILIDVNKDGVSILSTKIMIDAGEKTSYTASTPYIISDVSLTVDSELTFDIDQIGSTIAGKGLKLWILGRRSSIG